MFEDSVEVCYDEMLDWFVPGEDPGDAVFAKLFDDIPQGGGNLETYMYSALVCSLYFCSATTLMFEIISREGQRH